MGAASEPALGGGGPAHLFFPRRSAPPEGKPLTGDSPAAQGPARRAGARKAAGLRTKDSAAPPLRPGAGAGPAAAPVRNPGAGARARPRRGATCLAPPPPAASPPPLPGLSPAASAEEVAEESVRTLGSLCERPRDTRQPLPSSDAAMGPGAGERRGRAGSEHQRRPRSRRGARRGRLVKKGKEKWAGKGKDPEQDAGASFRAGRQ